MRLSAFAFGTVVAVAALTGVASAQNGFLEQFDSNAAGWRNFNGSAGLAWFAAGGPDGSGYARSSYNLSGTTIGGFPPTVIRAHSSYPSSGGAYVGNWITAGANIFQFDIRHNLAEAISMTGRFATTTNNPGASAVSATVIQPNVWTTVTFNLAEGSPDIISLGGGTYAGIFSNLGNIQLGFNVPASLAGTNFDATFDIDNARVLPAPGALALLGMGGMIVGRRRR